MVGICRLCASLRKMDGLIIIKNDSNEICQKLRKCCKLNIKMSDVLPKSICQDCFENLNISYNFYIKVNEAQETLKTLFSSPIPHEENEKSNEATSTPLEILQKPLKQIKLENYLLRQTKDFVKQSQDARSITATRQIKGDDIRELYIVEISKEQVCENSYKVLQTHEDNVEDLTDNEKNNYFDYRDICEQQQQLVDKHYASDENNSQNPLAVSREDDLQSDEVIRQINIIETDNEINLKVECMEYDEDEDKGNEKDGNKDIDKSFDISPPTAQLKLNSWKNYKFQCFICDDIYSSFIGLKGHFAKEHSTRNVDSLRYKCYDCKKTIPRYNFFLNHVRSKHHHDLKLRCDVCDLNCKNFQELSYHRSVNCTEAINHAHTVACNKCFKSFYNMYGLQNHIKYQHISSKTKVKYKCTQCSKEFQYKSCLKSHEQVHTDIKKFSCVYCDRSFYNKSGLDQHMYVHVNEKTFLCNICNKSYKSCQSLDEHKKLHTNEKTFKCEFCEKCFNQKIQKLTHERSHTGEMPFPCEHCGKRFRYSSALFAHTKVHTGCKPYSCEYCSKTFADSSNRNKHVRRMHLNCENPKNKEK